MPQTKSQIRALLEAAGLRPGSAPGQHFLIDGNLMRRLVEAAELHPTDTVLEVGCGTGSLTRMLAERAGHVVVAEIDARLMQIARAQLGPTAPVTFLNLDVLQSKSQLAEQVTEVLIARLQELAGRLLLVANLPYQIATPLLADLLLSSLPICRICATVQKEVADRLLARPGRKDYGPISVLRALTACGRRIARVPPQAFWPMPKVDSAIVRLDVHPDRLQHARQLRWTQQVVRLGFRHRRKTLGFNIRKAFGNTATEKISAAGLNPQTRPEQVSPEQWQQLARLLQPAPQPDTP